MNAFDQLLGNFKVGKLWYSHLIHVLLLRFTLTVNITAVN